MTAIPSEMNCPTPETLAAFVDGTLPPSERQAVIEHLADCADCRDIVLWATEMKAGEELASGSADAVVRRMPAEVTGTDAAMRHAQSELQPRFVARRILPLAAAAAIAVVVAVPFFRPDPVGKVAKELRTVTERPSEARLSVELPYTAARARNRGGEKVGSFKTQSIALDAAESAEKNPTVETLHAAGIASMYNGQHADAVEMLQRARAKTKTPSVALLNDLTAAYLGAGKNEEALKTADASLAIEQTPVALWNRALALEWLDQYDAAAEAWEKYLAVDRSSEWRAEAENHLGQVQQLRNYPVTP